MAKWRLIMIFPANWTDCTLCILNFEQNPSVPHAKQKLFDFIDVKTNSMNRLREFNIKQHTEPYSLDGTHKNAFNPVPAIYLYFRKLNIPATFPPFTSEFRLIKSFDDEYSNENENIEIGWHKTSLIIFSPFFLPINEIKIKYFPCTSSHQSIQSRHRQTLSRWNIFFFFQIWNQRMRQTVELIKFFSNYRWQTISHFILFTYTRTSTSNQFR